ncbi:MAG: adenylate/guanylate cyclase protein [Hyphomicrobiales bacterium]|nr:adenylate/guanylate cyclase protein [Hyphomicrobiales bacterium]
MNALWRRRIAPAVFGFAIVGALTALRLADPYPVQMAREVAFDLYQQMAPRPKTDLPVRVIDVDEASLAAIGQWPWPRNILATLTQRLGDMGAVAIAFDMLFPEPDRMSPARIGASLPAAQAGQALADYDADFAAALAATPSILGFSTSGASTAMPDAPKAGFAVSGGTATAIPPIEGAVVPITALADAAHGLGGLSLSIGDSIDVIKRLPLLWSDGKQFFPSLALEALRIAQGVQTIVILGETGGSGFIDSVRVGDITIPTTPTGDLNLYFRHLTPDLSISAKDILAADYETKAPFVAGQVVLIGTSASGLLDLRGTPLGENLPGVAIHAQAIEQILSGHFLTRGDWVAGLEILGFVVIGAVIVTAVLFSGPLLGLIFGMLVACLAVTLAWLAFTSKGWLIDPSFPLLGAFVVYSAMVFFRFAITDADRRMIRRAFGHYVAPALLTQIENSGDRLKLGGEVRDLTVMFADMRNFTAIGESLEPHRLLDVLNTLFGALGARITENFGTIDKFVGDAVMAFWNAPVDVENHARHACLAALGMRETLRQLNLADAFHLQGGQRSVDEIGIGIGIATGEALVGNMGLETRFDYSCVGNTVNVASRLEDACKSVGYDIIAAEATRLEAPDLAFLNAGSIALKGKSTREPVHLLVGDAALALGADFAALREEHFRAIAALRQGDDPKDNIAQCVLLAQKVEPHLPLFYRQLATRRSDFDTTVVAR